MKKKLLCLLLLFPFIAANADMAAPYVESYDAVITNPDGVKCEIDSKNINIPYDSKIHVIFEDNWEKAITIDFEYEYNNEIITCSGININNIKTINEKFEFKDSELSKNNYKGKVLIKDGLIMYKGPSSAYGKEGYIIPYDTEISLKAQKKAEEYGTAWYYTTINGHSGWVNVLNKSIGLYPNNDDYSQKKYIIAINYYKNDTTKKELLIPVNSEVKILYDSDPWSMSSYIEYNNSNYWVEDDYIVEYNKEISITLEEDTIMYEEFFVSDEKKSKEVAEIPLKTTIKSNYYFWYYDYYFVLTTYNGKTGWIRLNDDYSQEIESDEELKTTNLVQNNNTTSKKLNIHERIYLYIGGAVILSLTAFTTIVLINKKKKTNIDKETKTKKK